MLKKRLGIEAIEKRDWDYEYIFNFYKIPSTLIIPDGCKRIGRYVFSCCKNLKEVVIPESVKRIGDAAFWGCDKAVIRIERPESEFVYLAETAFSDCRDVEYAEEKTRT